MGSALPFCLSGALGLGLWGIGGIMDYLHTDPATGDQYWLSTPDDGPLSFADAQAAVVQHQATTQSGARASADSGYGYAPLSQGGSGGSVQASTTVSVGDSAGARFRSGVGCWGRTRIKKPLAELFR